MKLFQIESGYMIHNQQSMRNSNFGQNRDRQRNLNAREVRLYKASANITKFGLPKTRYVVPYGASAPNLLIVCKILT